MSSNTNNEPPQPQGNNESSPVWPDSSAFTVRPFAGPIRSRQPQPQHNYPALHTMKVVDTKRFSLEDLRRIPVHVSEKAQELINRSSREGRLFPLALSEAFGGHTDIAEIDLDAVPKREHFPLAPHEPDNTWLLRITIHHTPESGVEDGVRFLNAADLNEIHPSGLLGFNAALAAHEHLRLHVHEKGLRTRWDSASRS